MDGHHLMDTDEKIQYAPTGNDHALIGDLQANFNYTCTVWEGVAQQTQVLRGKVSEPCQFTTDYGGIIVYQTDCTRSKLIVCKIDPEEPTAPEIQEQQMNHSIKVVLFSSSTRYGPIRLVMASSYNIDYLSPFSVGTRSNFTW